MKNMLYDETLGNEWIDWVEQKNPLGSREQEIYPFIQKWLKKISPAVLADIGCGQGACSSLIDTKTHYIGIDPSNVLLKRAQELYPDINKEFRQGDSLDLMIKDASVDAVMSIWVWSHLDNLELAASEMSRILKRNGNFLIITANPETYEERRTFYKTYTEKDGLLIGTFDLGNGRVLTDSTLYLHSLKRIEDAILQSGLVIEGVDRLSRVDAHNLGLYLAVFGHT